ncbi:MAG: ABC transporter substrate-binding protein [Chloroflexi bacterium]|jgi:peptide/nickel transport system substrate-binding protein|nr:ABC transporter substrate-binding protein [Chloroflexota bacterium]
MVRYRLLAAGAIVAIVAAACGQGASPAPATQAPASEAPATQAPASEAPATQAPAETPVAGTPKEGGTFVVAIPGDLNRTDPALVDDANSTYVLSQVLETLVTLKPGTGGEIVPALAESWSISPDGLQYTFKIRQGVKFHDGTDLDAAAVKTNFDRWMTIPQAYVDLGYTYYIDTVITPAVKSVEAPDPTTVVVTLNDANSAFLIQMTLTPFAISSPKALVDGDASAPDFANNKYATGGPPAAVGTGPFTFKSWVPGTEVVLVKNPGYWNAAAGGPYLDQVTFKPITDSTATLNAIQAGEVDLVQAISPVDLATVQSDANLQAIDRGGSCNVGLLAMQSSKPPFDNLKIRQAVAAAVNRQALVDAFFGGAGVVPTTWSPPGTAYAKDVAFPAYDPEAAKQLIAESGVTDLSFDFWYPSDVTRAYMPDPKGEFEAILRDLEAVGFKPNPKTAPWRPDYLAAESTGEYPMWLIGWNCDWLGIDNFLYTAWFGYRGDPYGPNPEFSYKNDAANQAMLDALKATDPAGQEAAWGTALDLVTADMPALPIASAKTPGAAAAYVKGLIPSPTLLEIFQGVWLDK